MLHNGGDNVLENEPPSFIVMPEPDLETAMRVLNIKGMLETEVFLADVRFEALSGLI